MGVLFVPRKTHRAVDVPIDLVGAHGRDERHTRRHQAIHHLAEEHVVRGLLPDGAGVPEALCLIHVVVLGWKVLHTPAHGRLGVAIVMLDHRHAEFRGAHGIHHSDVRRGKVDRGDAACIVHGFGHGAEQLGVPRETPDPNHVCPSVNQLGCELGCARRVVPRLDLVEWRRVPWVARPGRAPVADRKHAGRCDTVLIGQPLLLEGLFPSTAGAVHHGCHPMGELQVVDVLKREVLASNVGMQVDEARHHVHAAGVDHAVALGHGARCRATGDSVVGDDLNDRVALDDDVGRPVSRAAVARDDHGVTNDQSLEGTFTRGVGCRGSLRARAVDVCHDRQKDERQNEKCVRMR